MSTLTVRFGRRGDVAPEPGHGQEAHTDTDIVRIITAFGRVAALIAEAQHDRAQ